MAGDTDIDVDMATAPATPTTTARGTSSGLLRLPREVLHNIFARVVGDDYRALTVMALTCRALRDLVDTDEGLWRAALLALYDDPRRAAKYPCGSRTVRWRQLVQDRVWARRTHEGWVREARTAAAAGHDEQNRAAGGETGFPADMVGRAPRLDSHDVARVADIMLGIALDMPPVEPRRDRDDDDDGGGYEYENGHVPSDGEDESGDDDGGGDDVVGRSHGLKPRGARRRPDASLNAPILDRFLRSSVFRMLYAHHGTRPGGAVQGGDDDGDSERRPITSGDTKWYPRPRRLIANEILIRLNTYARLEPDPRLLPQEAHFPRRRAFLRNVTYGADWLTKDTEFAPLHPDGTVDWVLVDAAGSLVALNILEQVDEREEQWFAALRPLYGMGSFRGMPFPRAVDAPRDGTLWDWAGVGGLWHYGYSFMNYRDWVHLCDADLMGLTPFDLVGYYEELGDRVSVPFEVVADEAAISAVYADVVARARARRAAEAVANGMARRDSTVEVPAIGSCSDGSSGENGSPQLALPSLATALPTSDRLPPIYFCAEGGSAASVAAGRPGFLHGVVRLTPDWPPQVRWTVVVTFDSYQFRMEGVQLGAVGSKRGWYGVWNDAQHSQQNASGPRPHGPVWFWKAQGGV